MWRRFLAVLAVLVLATGCVTSTPRVHEVEPGKVALPQGETLIMRYGKGTWEVTFDGQHLVTFQNRSPFGAKVVATVEYGGSTRVDFSWPIPSLTVTTDREVAYVHYSHDNWFSGWRYVPS